MIIILDYNNDKLIIEQEKDEITFEKVKQISLIQSILEEIFNRINVDGIIHDSINIELVKVDEDFRKTIGEW